MQELHLELPEEFTSYGAHAALHGVLYAACSKVKGPVLVVYGGELLKYTVQDVSTWQLPQISANVGPALAPRWLHPFRGASRRVETGAPRFSSVSIRSVPLAAKPLGPCTILVPESPIRSLWVGGRGRSRVGSLSSAEISAILPHLTLPHLEKLNIETNSIDPVALGAFLMRHPRIVTTSY
ncbi:hypothetical protein B0H14DRAFT_3439329 [Mycena olivaceomarginata]|nr:hypothetical protein B0H14DRAFT_3439329 [Mycena olivaceomarginata]